MSSNSPHVGQQYRDLSTTSHNSDWLIVAIYRTPFGDDHALLRSVRDPTIQKILAVTVIIDDKRFWPIETVA